MYKKIVHRSGASLVELILAMTVFSIVVFSISTSLFYGLESVSLSGQRIRATLLAEEGLEALRNIRDNDFATLADGTYGLDETTGEWVFLGSSDTIDGFQREISLLQLNGSTFEATSTVTWSQNLQRNGEVQLFTVLTNWMVESLVGDWSNPLVESNLNLAGSGSGWKIQVFGGYAYIVRQNGSPDFVIVDVSTTSVPLIVSNTAVSGSLRDIRVSGNYAYIASSTNNAEVAVYNISNPLLPILVDSLNLSGNDNAVALDLVGDVLYVVRNGGSDQFVAVDISDPTNITELDAFNLSGSSDDVEVLDGYAYITSNSNSAELTILDVTDPSNISEVDEYNYTGNEDGHVVEVFDNIVIVGRADGDVWISDYSDFNNPILLSVINIGDDINDMDVGNNNTYLFVGTDQNDSELYIIDISNLSSPSILGTYDASSDVNGVYYDPTTDRFYAITEDNSFELIILQPS